MTAAVMRTLDFDAGAKFGLTSATLMDNAGRAVANAAAEFLKTRGTNMAGAEVVVCCGRGANGGDGIVAASYLAAAGARVKVFLCPPKKGENYSAVVTVPLAKARAAKVAIIEAGPDAGLSVALTTCAFVLDALLGTGSSGKPAGAIHHMITEITKSKKIVLSVDIPSGIDPDSGYHSGVFVKAEATFALGLPKRGLLAAHAAKNVGELKVLDIGYPPELLKTLTA